MEESWDGRGGREKDERKKEEWQMRVSEKWAWSMGVGKTSYSNLT